MRTLEDLTNELAIRLGFGAQQGASIIQQPLLQSALRSAQIQLYEEFGQELLYVINEYDPGNLITGEQLYDFPDDCDPNRIQHVSICHGGRYYEIDRGITTLRRNSTEVCEDKNPSTIPDNDCDNPPQAKIPAVADWSRPVRWDMRLGNDALEHDGNPTQDPHGDLRKGQFEVWPIPDAYYGLKLEYYRKMLPFNDGKDRASINEELLLLHSLVNMKSHYRQPDAQVYAGQLQNLLGRMRGKQLYGIRFNKLRQRRRISSGASGGAVSPGFQHIIEGGGAGGGRLLITLDTVDIENPDFEPVLTEKDIQ